MLQGKNLILATREYAREDRAKSWYYAGTTLTLLVLLFSGTYWNLNWGLRALCSVGSILVFSRMFVIYHDYMHHSILQNSSLAKAIFYVFGLFTLAPNSIWKRTHDYHHNNNSKLYNANIGSFPVATKMQFLKAGKRDRFLYLAARHPVTILFGYLTVFIYGMCIQPLLKKTRQHYDALLALFIHITWGTCLFIYGGFSALLLTMIIPYFMTFSLGAYLFYAQHKFPGVRYRDKNSWTYEEAALQSSSYMIMGRFMRWTLANISYHHIHHINSRIPFYRLPEVMNKIPELQTPKTTSLHWKDIVACLQLKVWCPEEGRMLRLSEV